MSCNCLFFSLLRWTKYRTDRANESAKEPSPTKIRPKWRVMNKPRLPGVAAWTGSNSDAVTRSPTMDIKITPAVSIRSDRLSTTHPRQTSSASVRSPPWTVTIGQGEDGVDITTKLNKSAVMPSGAQTLSVVHPG